MKKTQKIFFLWLFLVALWNFGAPDAKPIYDVAVAAGLSFIVKLLEKHV